MAQPITIDPDRIQTEISTLESRIAKLRGLLDGFEELKCFADSPAELPTNGPGRPVRDNPYYKSIKAWIYDQPADFTNGDMRAAVNATDRHIFGVALRALVKKGHVIVVKPPKGRRPGLYRKGERR